MQTFTLHPNLLKNKKERRVNCMVEFRGNYKNVFQDPNFNSINRIDGAPCLGISSTSKLDVIPIYKLKLMCTNRQLFTDAPFSVKARAPHKKTSYT